MPGPPGVRGAAWRDRAMLFNSFEFLLFFLPLTLVAYHGCRAGGLVRTSIVALTVASIGFYAWWDWRNTFVLAASIAFNFAIARLISRRGDLARPTLAVGIVGNLLLLGYFKYWNFLASNVNEFARLRIPLLDIALPLGISFFTFTQIAFLVDTYRGLAREYSPVRYVLFASYFPHLIAGPIIHHRQLIPQFDRRFVRAAKLDAFNLGVLVFILGLAKKVLLADNLAEYANPVFAAAAKGLPIDSPSAWAGVLAYTLQLYFDFSGYSDMAVGLSKMFGINLPINFNTPYRATSVIEFWRRWHMTLSSFLREYLYIPLGGNRKGRWRRYVNLLATMLLGGLWHGAGWTFVIWGGVHGIALAANHVWREHLPAWWSRVPSSLRAVTGWVATFSVVVFGWVYFRAADVTAAHRIIEALFALRQSGWGGFYQALRHAAEVFASLGWTDRVFVVLGPGAGLLPKHSLLPSTYGAFLIPLLLSLAIAGPNALAFACSVRQWCRSGRPTRMIAGYFALALVALAFFACLGRMNNASDFLYFQF
jgi:D-alanyl-lipoteichoic acid acyltransferase DltB (MBOAT superfamily)